MPPPSNPAAFETDLPPELLQQGWRKFWSRRENRPYFFNRMSGDTMWEMPPIHVNNHSNNMNMNPLNDPLGINQSNNQNQNQMQIQPGMKRRPSEEMNAGGKKLILAGPWDLEIPTNVILYERQPTRLPHPTPEVELLRFGFVMKLRQSYQVNDLMP